MTTFFENKSPVVMPATLVEMLRQQALEQPDRCAYTFLVDGESQEVHLTYAQLDRRARAIAAQMQNLGMRGERALLLYPSGLEYISAFFGCLYSGVVAIPASPPNPAQLERTLSGLQNILADAQAVMVLTTTAVQSMAEKLFAQLPQWQNLHWLTTDNILNYLAENWHDSGVSGDTLAMLQYTSGSTAAPKGVMLNHNNILHNQGMIARQCGHTEQSTYVSWLPLHHNLGLMACAVQSCYIGARCILMSPLAFLQKPHRWLQAISRYQARTSAGPTFAYNLCVQKIDPQQMATFDLTHWELAMVGGEPVQYEILERFAATFAHQGFRLEAFFPGYGMAESTVMISGGQKGQPPTVKVLRKEFLEEGQAVEDVLQGSDTMKVVGYELLAQEQHLTIVQPDTLVRCLPGKIGEIWVASPSVACGYWGQSAKTQETFQSYLDTGEGPFLRTGDLGFIKDGKLFITGRYKDLIIINGRNHYPQDIELTVHKSHSAIHLDSCAAFSVTTAGQERLVVAVEINVSDGADVSRSDIEAVIQAVQKAVAVEHGLNTKVVLLKPGSIPKTSIGKIQHFACRAGFIAGSLAVWELPS